MDLSDYSNMQNCLSESGTAPPMPKLWSIYHGRLQRFLSTGYMPEMNITSFLVKHRAEEDITIEMWSPPFTDNNDDAEEHVSFQEAKYRRYSPAEVGTAFGPTWSTHWFKITIRDHVKYEGYHFHWKTQAEGLVWTANGHAVHGLSPQDRSNFPLNLVTATNSEVEDAVFFIEMSCNGLFGNGQPGMIDPPVENSTFLLEECDLRLLNQKAYSLYYDLQIMEDLINQHGEGHPLSKRALFVANKVINLFDISKEIDSSLETGLEITRNFLQSNQGSSLVTVYAVGNCHIDTAWLWRYKETRRKTARSWSSQLALLQEHSQYTFALSQMQQLEWLRLDYPELFERIQAAHKAGKFIPIGGTWVEMDGNLPSGESFCRQFLYGQRFMKTYFGEYSEIFWLPDTFGYNAQLPQIMKQAGIKYFVTQKLSWNNINSFPHTSFKWEGLDGTSILTHFPPSNTYTAQGTIGEVIRSERDHKDIERSDCVLLLYGHGDGGGGPTEAMIKRLEKISNSKIASSVKFSTPKDFFSHLEQHEIDLLSWKGELYFELHRGTYTSQAKTKFYNRKCEIILKEAEMLSVINGLVNGSQDLKQKDITLEGLWKKLLLNQFHDVLPGSSINAVYKDAVKLYEEIFYNGTRLRDEAMNGLFGCNQKKRGEGEGDVTENVKDGVVIFNTTPFSRSEVLIVPWNDNNNSPQPGVIAVSNINGLSMTTLEELKVKHHMSKSTDQLVSIYKSCTEGHVMMENSFIKVIFDEKGHIISIFDKEVQREVIDKTGNLKANSFILHEDIPFYWDAWDVEVYHLEKYSTVSEECKVQLSVGMEGPIMVSLLRVLDISPDSRITQVISLTNQSKRLEFTCNIEWHENHKFLKVFFPVSIKSDFATFECPFGMVQRPTHRNTSWDVARFEVCGHKFADLSEGNYGMALLSDCKYGYAVRGNIMSLSLLRSPKFPDPECDMGEHIMRFAILPHLGNVVTGRVVEDATCFNTPILWTSASEASFDHRWTSQSIISFENSIEGDLGSYSSSLIIDTVKMAEDESNNIIIRAYEGSGCRGEAFLLTHPLLSINRVMSCNILEEDIEVIKPDDRGHFIIPFTPFQIITLKVNLSLTEPTYTDTAIKSKSLSDSSFVSL